jgi:hypothetical protein
MVQQAGGNVAKGARKAGGGTGKVSRGKSKGTAGKGTYQGANFQQQTNTSRGSKT